MHFGFNGFKWGKGYRDLKPCKQPYLLLLGWIRFNMTSACMCEKNLSHQVSMVLSGYPNALGYPLSEQWEKDDSTVLVSSIGMCRGVDEL